MNRFRVPIGLLSDLLGDCLLAGQGAHLLDSRWFSVDRRWFSVDRRWFSVD
jgi:hypothetical protein